MRYVRAFLLVAMRAAAFLPLSALLGLAVVALPACSSSKPARAGTAATTTAAPTRGEADVMAAGPNGPGAAGAPGERRVFQSGPGMNMTPEQRVNMRLTQLKEALALSEAQEGRIRALIVADVQNAPRMRREDMQAMSQEQMMQMGQQMQERRTRLNTAIEAELTPDQVQLYRAFVQQERDRMMQRARQQGGM